MAIGTWAGPLLGVGAGHDERCETIYEALLAELGDGALSHSDMTATGVEIIAFARALDSADAWIDLRIAQWDPSRMTVMIERWEAVLGIAPASLDTEADRRARIGARLLGYFSAQSGSISKICNEAFAPWTVNLRFASVSTAVMHWPGGTPTEALWYSTVAHICVEYVRPSGATDAEVETRRAACSSTLEEYLPAWATYALSETSPGYGFGFRVGVSRLGYAALSEV